VPAQHDDFAEFYEASYGRMVALVAAIVGDRSQAEDIAQEAFSRALTRWQRVARYDLPEAWVRKVALRLTIDATRRTRHNPHQPGLGLRVLNVTAPGNLLQASRLIVSYSRYCMATAACQDGQLITADGSKVLVTKVLPGGQGYTDSVLEYSTRTGQALASLVPVLNTPYAGPPCVPLWTDPSDFVNITH
jgi:hypothetical protein